MWHALRGAGVGGALLGYQHLAPLGLVNDWLTFPQLLFIFNGGRERGLQNNQLYNRCNNSSRVNWKCAHTISKIAASVPILSGSCFGIVTWCSPSLYVVRRIWLPVCLVISYPKRFNFFIS